MQPSPFQLEKSAPVHAEEAPKSSGSAAIGFTGYPDWAQSACPSPLTGWKWACRALLQHPSVAIIAEQAQDVEEKIYDVLRAIEQSNVLFTKVKGQI